MKEDPLVYLYSDPWLYLARLLSYGGLREADLKEQLKPLVEKHSDGKMTTALSDLTWTDEKTRLVYLRPHVRKLCWQLLGPPPEHPWYERFWEGREKPANHQPPKDEEPKKKRTKKKKEG